MATIPAGRGTWYLTIEGYGKTSALSSSGDEALWRLSTGSVSSTIDTDGLVKPVWAQVEEGRFACPSLAAQIDFRKGSLTIEDGSFLFVTGLPDDDLDLSADLLRPSGRAAPVAQLDISGGDLAAGTTTIVLDTSGLGGQALYYKRELLVLGSESPTNTYTGCYRGVQGTRRETASTDRVGEDLELRDVFDPRRGRIVSLYVLPESATSLSDEVLVWRGVLHNTGRSSPTVVQLDCKGLVWLLRNTKLMREPWTAEVVGVVPAPPLVGSASLRFSSIRLKATSRPGEEIAQRPASVAAWPNDLDSSSQDKTLVRLGDSIYEVEWAGNDEWRVTDPRRPLLGTKLLRPDDINVGDIAHEVFPVWDQGPSPQSSPTDGDLPLGGTDGDVATGALQLLTSTYSGGNGAFDTGIPFGVGLPSNYLDTDGFTRVKLRLGDQLQMPRNVVGVDGPTEAQVALDVLEKEFFAPNECCLSVTLDGLLTLVSFVYSTDPDQEEVTVTDADLIEPVTWASGDNATIDTVDASWRREASGKSYSLNVNDILRKHRAVGQSGADELDGGGWESFGKAWRAAQTRLFRWALAIPRLVIKTPLDVNLPLGRISRLTCNHVPNIASDGTWSEGVTRARIMVTRKELHPAEGHFVYHALHVDLGMRLGRIAPAARVESYPGSDVVAFYANAYVPASDGLYLTDLHPWEAGDYVDLLDQYGTVREAGLKIDSIDTGAQEITFTTTPSVPPADGDVIIPATYDTCTEEQQDLWMFLADSGGTVGAAGDDGYTYEG